MAIDTVAVTGASGRIGSEILRDLDEHGYRTANLDRRRDGTADRYCEVDLLDAGETYGALAAVDADAVIHMGTLASPLSAPGYVTFASNALSSYHVLEAADELGLEAACLASSINAMGFTYQDVPPEIEYLPVDEDHPKTPRDPYAIGKHVTEEIADGFARAGAPETIATVRYPAVLREEDLRERFAGADRSLDALHAGWDPNGPSNDLFSYIHVADAASITRRAIEADYEGHETFWAVAADTNAAVPTETLIEEFHPDVEVRTSFDGHEGLVSIEKARDLLGWEPEHSWRDL